MIRMMRIWLCESVAAASTLTPRTTLTTIRRLTWPVSGLRRWQTWRKSPATDERLRRRRELERLPRHLATSRRKTITLVLDCIVRRQTVVSSVSLVAPWFIIIINIIISICPAGRISTLQRRPTSLTDRRNIPLNLTHVFQIDIRTRKKRNFTKT